MLYGTLIFIKKSGSDGSKYPVTNKSLKIGKSDECVIRIQNPLISPEHCQLTVDDNGQAKIRNLSTTNPTILNDQPLGNGEFVLHQGDVFKLGERYARWEYQPTSKYYHQPSTSSQRLVAVVPPQERVSVGLEGGNADNFSQTLKRRYSERVSNSGKKSVKKTISLGSGRGVPNKTKLIGRHSLQLKRLAFSPQVKLRKITSVESLVAQNTTTGNKTPLRCSSKWEVKTVTPEKGKSPQVNGTNRKSTPIKVPMSQLSNDSLIKSTIKSASKIPDLLPIAETSPPTAKIAATHSLEDVPESLNISTSPKSPMKIVKTPTPKKIKMMSPRKSLSMSNKNKNFSRSLLMDAVPVLPLDGDTLEGKRTSQKFTPSKKTTLRKSVLKKSISQSDLNEIVSSDEKGTPKKSLGTPRGKRKSSIQSEVMVNHSMIETADLPNETKNDSPVQTPVKSGRKSKLEISTSTPLSTPKCRERLSRNKKSIPSGVLSTPKEKENVKVSPRAKPASARKSSRAAATPPKRGTKREFSAIASAERAAKKLKTIAPTKPDKNKKAALLVLGKASRKLKLIPNTHVVIKRKIVKKAIKLSTKSKKRVKPVKKASPSKSIKQKKKTIQDSKKSPFSSLETATSTRRQSTSTGETPIKDTSPSKQATTVDNTKTGTASRRVGKGVTSPLLNKSLSLEALNSSVPSKASDIKCVTTSPNSSNNSFQYISQVIYDSSRRVSKRLNSPNSNSRPDFMELTPTALGLTPKSIAPEFNTSKPANRRSSSLVTPKNKGIPTGMKAASTSKIHRKSVRFSARDLNVDSFNDRNATNGTLFDFDGIHTPDITIDRFISPLSNQKSPSSAVKRIQKDTISPQKETPTKTESSSSSPTSKSPKSPVRETRSLKTPEQMKTQELEKSQKNNLMDVKEKRQLMKTPKAKKNHENDLFDVKEVRQRYENVMKTPQPRKSPKNDLSDVRGVRRLLGSPKIRRSPKNDLTDVRGVRRLMESPKPQKSPKNDLTDVRGVRRLLGSPKIRRSPKNDLTDVRGVRRLMESPKPQKSPKNDLTDVKGVRRLMESPRLRKSPRNDLTDVTGVKQLLITKSPKNDLTNVSGLETLFESPPTKIQCLRTLYNPVSEGPKNNLNNVDGVHNLFSKNNENKNLDVSLTGVAELFLSSNEFDSPRKQTSDTASTASAINVSRISDIQTTDNRPTLRGAIRSSRKASGVNRGLAAQSPITSDGESPKVVKRETRSMRATKVEKPVEVKRLRTKSEREVEVKEGRNEGDETVSTRSTRLTRKRLTKRQVEDAEPVKRIRKAMLADEKPTTPSKASAASKAKKEPAKDATPESKPSPIRTRRKSMARQSPKPVKRSTRAKASESFEMESQPKAKAKTAEETVVSPVKTRQRKAKEVSLAKKATNKPSAKKPAKSSPVRTRRKAK